MGCKHGHAIAECPDERCRGRSNTPDLLADYMATHVDWPVSAVNQNLINLLESIQERVTAYRVEKGLTADYQEYIARIEVDVASSLTLARLP